MVAAVGSAESWIDAMGRLSVHEKVLAGVRTRVFERVGDGATIAFLHGLTGQAEIWLPMMPWLPPNLQLLALDLVGRGRSELPEWVSPDNVYDTMVDQALAALDDAGAKRAVLVGSSLGSLIAGLIALRHPERVEKLVLCNSGLMANERNRQAGASNAASERLAMLTPPVTISTLVSHLSDTIVDLRRVAPEYLLARLATYNSDIGQEHAARISYCTRQSPPVGDLSVRDRAAELSMPTLLVWGDRDPRIPVEAAEKVAARIPDATVEVFEDSGHFPFLEFPERFAGVLTEFVARAGRSA